MGVKVGESETFLNGQWLAGQKRVVTSGDRSLMEGKARGGRMEGGGGGGGGE